RHLPGAARRSARPARDAGGGEHQAAAVLSSSIRHSQHNAAMPGNTWGLVYGTIAIGALLAAETAQSETYIETVGGVLIALVIYWLAHAYSEFTQSGLTTASHSRSPPSDASWCARSRCWSGPRSRCWRWWSGASPVPL